MIAVDTNILVYAHRLDSEWNEKAFSCLAELAVSPAAWAIPWPCLHEFFAVVTHPCIYDPPTTPEQAVTQMEAWLESPSLVLLAEDEGYFARLKQQLLGARSQGPRVHDARIAALCELHGVRELWTADRDFGRFSVNSKNPLI